MAQSISERLLQRLQELTAKHGFQAKLARKLSVSDQAITRLVAGDTTLTVDALEAIAEVSGIPVAELVVPPSAVIKQLDAEEAALLRYLRRWPKTVSRALIVFVAFFADEEPAETQTRNLHELYRHLDAPMREALYGFAIGLREKSIPPDIERALFERLSAESKAAAGKPERRREK